MTEPAPEEVPQLEELFEDVHVEVTDDLSYPNILRMVEQQLDAAGWDQHPMVAIVLGGEMGVQFISANFPDEIMDNFSIEFPMLVNEMVQYLAEFDRKTEELLPIFRSLMDNVLDKGFQGLLISTEGWSLEEPGTDAPEEKKEAFERARRRYSISEHPDRQEVRSTWIMTPVSDVHWLHRVRGQEPEYIFINGEQWEPGLYGQIMEYGRHFMRVLLTLMLMKGLVSEEVLNYWYREAKKTPGHPFRDIEAAELQKTVREYLERLKEKEEGSPE